MAALGQMWIAGTSIASIESIFRAVQINRFARVLKSSHLLKAGEALSSVHLVKGKKTR